MNPEAIKFVVLGVVGVGVVLRLPSATRGRNVGIFTVLVLMFLGVGLGIESIYLSVDGILGGQNIANLVIRYSVFAIFVILGTKMARAFEAPRAAWWIMGPFGLVVLAGCSVLALVFFILSDLPQSSVGLIAYNGQSAVQWYATMGRIYPGFVALCLVVPASRFAASRQYSRPARLGASLLALGFVILPLYVLARDFVPVLGIWDVILPFSVVFLVAVGLTLFLVARHIGQRSQRMKALPYR